jgi:purine-binding chemotaxis protein CheW
MATKQFVIFSINNENFGVEIVQVKEIIKPMEIFKVPDTPAYIEGLINLRGKVHTVFNLRKKFHLPDKELDDNTKIIIVNVNELMVGFIVDEVMEIIRVEDADIEMTPPSITTLNKKYLNGIAKVGEKVLILIDLGQALSIEEEQIAGRISK